MYTVNNIQTQTGTDFKQSVLILGLKLFLILFIFESLGLISNIFLLETKFFPLEMHTFLHSVLFVINTIIHFIQTILVLKIILNWLGNSYYFDIQGKRLIKKEGLINLREQNYDLNNLRSYAVNQSFFGKVFHYGDVILETSASGGYQETIFIIGISNPKQCETILQQCLYTG